MDKKKKKKKIKPKEYCRSHLEQLFAQKVLGWDGPRGPVVKNQPSSSGDAGSIPGLGTKTPHAAE